MINRGSLITHSSSNTFEVLNKNDNAGKIMNICFFRVESSSHHGKKSTFNHEHEGVDRLWTHPVKVEKIHESPNCDRNARSGTDRGFGGHIAQLDSSTIAY